MRRLVVLSALAVFVTGAPAAAQQAPPTDPVALMTGGFEEVANFVVKSAEMVPADKYTYRPTQSVRTFAQLVAHVADAHNWYCGNVTKNTPWSDPVEKGPLDKATLVAKLKQSIDGCRAVYNAKGRPMPMLQNIGHSNLHYGNMITYLRMMGLTPPSS